MVYTLGIQWREVNIGGGIGPDIFIQYSNILPSIITLSTLPKFLNHSKLSISVYLLFHFHASFDLTSDCIILYLFVSFQLTPLSMIFSRSNSIASSFLISYIFNLLFSFSIKWMLIFSFNICVICRTLGNIYLFQQFFFGF